MAAARRREKMFPLLPTLLTLGNAVCGFGSITLAAKLGPVATQYDTLFVPAALIFLAMVFDMLDGYVARLTNQTSEFGAQLDSLCDVISFGVAPVFLMLKFPQVLHPRLLWMIAVLFLVCAALRLARFNVQLGEEESHDWFVGLPSPAAAGLLASIAVALPGVAELADPAQPPMVQAVGNWLAAAIVIAVPIITLAAACLMVSRIRYPHVANQLFRSPHKYQQLLQVIFAIVVVVAVHEVIPLILCYYVLASPARALVHKLAAIGRWKPARPPQ